MLIELRLENYAVIDNLVVEFGQGLNLLTGETGAGKSILIDALALLLGDKASSDVIRAGADRAVVAAVFESGEAVEKGIAKILEANGLDESDDGSLILRREIATGGKGRVFVNNQPATVAVLRLLAPHLAIIHAQNESILSFDGPARLEFSMRSRAARRMRRRPHSPHGNTSDLASMTSSAESRIGCAWWIYGFSKSARSKKVTHKPAKMSVWSRKSEFSPTPRKFTTPL